MEQEVLDKPKKTCRFCEMPFKEERVTKRYCCLRCKQNYEAEKQRRIRKEIAVFYKNIYQNADILDILWKANRKVIDKDELIEMGFDQEGFEGYIHVVNGRRFQIINFQIEIRDDNNCYLFKMVKR